MKGKADRQECPTDVLNLVSRFVAQESQFKGKEDRQECLSHFGRAYRLNEERLRWMLH